MKKAKIYAIKNISYIDNIENIIRGKRSPF